MDGFGRCRDLGGEPSGLLDQIGLIHESRGDVEAAPQALADALRAQSRRPEARLGGTPSDKALS